ncbi:MAG: TerB family tellurite resistance protein [Rhizobiales bacterium]|nr:TerB family tellurite resistance protein [Hyphomicrobiales bacterium]
MFARLKRLLTEPSPSAGSARAHSFEEKQLAAAALMVEAARLDDDFDADERARIASLLQAHFALSAAEADDLLAAGEQASSDSVEWQGFTRAIKDGFAPEERMALIEMLWEVAYADGTLHDYEASLIRRITGLLYVSDRDSGEARKRVRVRLGIS